MNDTPTQPGSHYGVMPLWLTMLFLMTGPIDSWAWVRIASSTLAAIVSVLICYVTATFVLNRKAGHKWLHALAFLYFGLRAIVHVWIAFDWWFQIPHLPLWIMALSNSSEIIFGMYYFVTRRDLAVTYKRSEEARLLNLRRLANINQAALNLEYISQLQTLKGHQITELIHNVGRN